LAQVQGPRLNCASFLVGDHHQDVYIITRGSRRRYLPFGIQWHLHGLLGEAEVPGSDASATVTHFWK